MAEQLHENQQMTLPLTETLELKKKIHTHYKTYFYLIFMWHQHENNISPVELGNHHNKIWQHILYIICMQYSNSEAWIINTFCVPHIWIGCNTVFTVAGKQLCQQSTCVLCWHNCHKLAKQEQPNTGYKVSLFQHTIPTVLIQLNLLLNLTFPLFRIQPY